MKASKNYRQPELPLPVKEQALEPSPIFHGIKALERIKKLLRERNLSIEEMAEFLSTRRSRPVSIPTARAWFASARPDFWPSVLDFIAMCEYLDDLSPLNELLESLGWVVIGRREQRLLAAAEISVGEVKQRIRHDEAERILTSIALEDERGGGKR